MKQYISFEVMEGAYDVSCPDPSCATQVSETELITEKSNLLFQGVLTQSQMEALTDVQLMEKHRTFRLNTGKLLGIANR